MALHSKELELARGKLACKLGVDMQVGMQADMQVLAGKQVCTQAGTLACTLAADKPVGMLVEDKQVGKQVCTPVGMVVRKQEQYYRSTCQSNQPTEVL